MDMFFETKFAFFVRRPTSHFHPTALSSSMTGSSEIKNEKFLPAFQTAVSNCNSANPAKAITVNFCNEKDQPSDPLGFFPLQVS